MQDNDIDGSGKAASAVVTAPQTVADVLDAAADLLEKPGVWWQGWEAVDAEVFPVTIDSQDACAWCMMGATAKVDPEGMGYAADEALARFLGQKVGAWNDAPGRTQSEVVAALRAAATSARQGETK